ncbi:MAG: S8 family serine peptidase, partial [Chloroflexota bacterium]|nr:S8 family serine peptidase [Chloroflexota bacterium]
MGKGIRWWARLLLGCALLAAALSVRPLSASPEGDPRGRPYYGAVSTASLEPELLRALAAPGDAPLRIIVVLRSPAGPTPLTQAAEAGSGALQARHALVDALQTRLARSRAPLTGLLASAGEQGDLLAQCDLWIINGLALTARPTLLAALAAAPAVAELRLDHERQYLNVEISSGGSSGPVSLGPSAPNYADRARLWLGQETGHSYLQLTATQVSTATDEIPWGVLRIRAPEVWETLAISGAGAVVAGMDTGVDWQHPDLQPNYRGNQGHGIVIHEGAWFDAVNDGVYPYDDHGHGTHTLGTAAGRGGIGVAPGARWIGVKVLNGNGSGLDSWIHAGFQWLLAPNGDPALAPDVVNCSWGATDARSTVFQADVETLLAAGIFPVFAAGNEGPYAGSLRSPASLPGVFAVGASDPNEAAPYFSSRGPSPWGEVKPYVVAPGVDTRSAAPGGVYAYMQGTSMATPHVAGVAALMRGVSPTLPVSSLAHIITETAHPFTTSLPSNISGWGRVDAFDALLLVAHPGFVTGTVRSTGGTLLPSAEVRATPHGGGGSALATTGADGVYHLALRPTTYDLRASAFGYTPQTQWGVTVLSDTTQRVDFAALGPLPTGVLQGEVTVAETGEPVSATVVLCPLGTPLTTTVDVTGHYAFSLPTGHYTVEARGSGYRVATAPVTITAGLTTIQDFALDTAPTLLLVDEGAWYYGSQIAYWRAALEALGYVYDEALLTQASLPPDFYALLDSHDVVLWSSPQGSPGLVNAGESLKNYLGAGGRLLLSGQDVAYFDSGSALYVQPQPYLGAQLSVRYLADDARSRTVIGSGPFEGLTAAIEGGDGADNQHYPDEVAVRDLDKATLFWEYAGGRGGGVGAHICTPYRALFFSFGYEALAGAATREEVLERSLAWLATPPLTRGLTLKPEAGKLIALPGEQVTHTLHLRHIGMAGPPDSMTVNLSGNRWPTTVTPTVMTLAPCDSVTLTVRVHIPPD